MTELERRIGEMKRQHDYSIDILSGIMIANRKADRRLFSLEINHLISLIDDLDNECRRLKICIAILTVALILAVLLGV